MKHHDIILHDRIPRPGVKPGRLGRGHASGQPENPGPTNDRQLPILLINWIMTHHTNTTPIILPTTKHKIDRHNKAHFLSRCRPSYPLGPAQHPRPAPRPNSQRVVDHGDQPEKCRRAVSGVALRDPDGGRVATAYDVVEEEVELGDLLFGVAEVVEP